MGRWVGGWVVETLSYLGGRSESVLNPTILIPNIVGGTEDELHVE